MLEYLFLLILYFLMVLILVSIVSRGFSFYIMKKWKIVVLMLIVDNVNYNCVSIVFIGLY